MSHPAQRVAEDSAPSATLAAPPHVFQEPPAGSTVDQDRCTKCGCTFGDSHHASPAGVEQARRSDAARARLIHLRAVLLAVIAVESHPDARDLFTEIDRDIRAALSELSGLAPEPYQIADFLPKRQAA